MGSGPIDVPALGLADRRILVVEDDDTVREIVATYLDAAGYIVDQATDGFAALDSLRTRMPDLIVMDRMLPGIDGAEVCRRIRLEGDVPIILLTALGSEDDRIGGLEAGADDYVTKPFSPRELVLRVTSVLRRSIAEFAPEAPFELGPFHLEPSARVIERSGEPLSLSAREFDLFSFLLKHPQRAFTREELLSAVWGWEIGDLSTVTVTMRRLREKVETDPTAPRVLQTVWGVGYRLSVEE
ncbi:response regulator transcription factor [Microbacterium sp. HD4P20]|uniref:response regulator transcription factor n=1 Tax=Microbacterium sp. HD4P20 TaxID=2864874 RepID=UPI001C63FF06|nr:response regulator transcription factor [Microbacterium sp. HD4P20]MCP2637631.1 response regulator transcription factor [Microbacterium sp. HD4P20]